MILHTPSLPTASKDLVVQKDRQTYRDLQSQKVRKRDTQTEKGGGERRKETEQRRR